MAKKFCKVKGIHNAFNLNQNSSDYDFNQLKSSIQDIANSNTIMFIITDSNDANVHAKYASGSTFIWTNNMLFNCNDTTYQAASSTSPGIVKISDTSTSSETDVAATVNQIRKLYETIDDNEYLVAAYAATINDRIGLEADLSHMSEYIEEFGNISHEEVMIAIASKSSSIEVIDLT